MENKVKKVCFFINKITLAGGAERVICNLASEFAARGIEATIITQASTDCGYPLHPGVQVVATKTGCRIPGLRLFLRCIKLRKLVKSMQPDVLISFMTMNNILALIFTVGLSVPRICSERIYPGLIKGFRAKLRDFTYPLSDGFVFQTQEAKDFFNEKIKQRSTIIYNPLVDNIPARSDARAKTIVTAGRLTKQKNHALLIRSFAAFHKEFPDYKLVIYGEGEQRAALQQQIAELGLEDCAFLPGASKTLLKEMTSAAMFVLSSDYEGMPNVLAEAMAIGLPCISTDCIGGGAKALIRHGVNGLLVPRGEEQPLLDAMRSLAENEALAESLGREASKLKETLSNQRITQQWLEYIRLVLARQK